MNILLQQKFKTMIKSDVIVDFSHEVYVTGPVA